MEKQTRSLFSTRIIGGQEVQPYSIKYQASLQYETGYHYCGGTLIDRFWVELSMRVVLSEHNLLTAEGVEQVFNVSKILTKYYNYKSFNNDIMLIKLSKAAQLNLYVQPAMIQLNPQTDLKPGIRCTVSGWGVTQVYSSYLSPVLRSVDVQIIPYCFYYYWGRITNNMICAGSQFGGKDSCQGDSGGPLICDGYFEGIVSWGISCANPYFPGVYTKVRNYGKWIQLVISLQ
ncbi:hypothetical protein CRUP_031162 [Coryphaenoides rupestris]|nr:hypothetical protein CRUP_031162 [Coryphaenoides rupestris]